MPAVTPGFSVRSRRLPRLGRLLLLAAVLVLPASVRAAGPAGDGLFLPVGTLTSAEVNRIKRDTEEALAQFNKLRAGLPDAGVRFKIVLDFNPDEHPNTSDDYGPCSDLADYLLALQQKEQGVLAIAFVHGEVSGHVVLPVLACQDLVMAPKPGTTIGNVGPTKEHQRLHYEDVLRQHLGDNEAIGLKLLDSAHTLKVQRVRPLGEKRTFWVDAAALQKAAAVPEVPDGRGRTLKTPHGDLKVEILTDPVDPAEPGTARYDTKRALEFGLCARGADSWRAVAEAYQLPPSSMRAAPLLVRNPQPWLVEIKGEFTRSVYESTRRRIRRAIGKGCNLLFVEVDCTGGDLQAALDLAKMLRDLKDDSGDNPVPTIAYIPRSAPDTGAIIALGCSQIVMHKDAQFGDMKEFVDQDPVSNANAIKAIQSIAEIYPPALIVAFMDRNATVYSVISAAGREWRLLTQEELDREPADNWRIEEKIKDGHDGNLLILRAARAHDLYVARHVSDAAPDDLAAVYKLYGVEAGDVKPARQDWLDAVAEFLRHPLVAVLLVVVGVACLILELKLPGVTLPGIIAAICFILFFWSQSRLSGQFTWLAILLFALGLLLILLEIFVLPGFGVPGIAGIILVLVSLALVTLERRPETSREWLSFGATLTTFALGIIAAIFLALVLAWYLPHIPYVNRLVLKPHGEGTDTAEEAESTLLHPELAALLGAIGVAATPLRPAGKVQFGDDFVDVVAEGSYVVPGTRVQVIEIEGNRVVVKEV